MKAVKRGSEYTVAMEEIEACLAGSETAEGEELVRQIGQ